MKLKFLMLIFSFLILTACGVTKPVATTHTERIEEKMMPIPVGTDTIEIILYQTLEKQSGLDTPDERSDPQYKTSVASQNNSIFLISHSSLRSTRPISLQTHHTDTTSTLRITLRPDTVFVPYTNHIRSDTIVVPDRICKTKLQKTQTANVLLILILIIVIIFLLKQKYKFYR